MVLNGEDNQVIILNGFFVGILFREVDSAGKKSKVRLVLDCEE